eukprot:6492760-Amphidinium_carterae.4
MLQTSRPPACRIGSFQSITWKAESGKRTEKLLELIMSRVARCIVCGFMFTSEQVGEEFIFMLVLVVFFH